MSKAHAFIKAHAIQPQSDDYRNFLADLLSQHDHEATDDLPDGSKRHTFDDGSQAITQPCMDGDIESFEALLADVDDEDDNDLESEDYDDCDEEEAEDA